MAACPLFRTVEDTTAVWTAFRDRLFRLAQPLTGTKLNANTADVTAAEVEESTSSEAARKMEASTAGPLGCAFSATSKDIMPQIVERTTWARTSRAGAASAGSRVTRPPSARRTTVGRRTQLTSVVGLVQNVRWNEKEDRIPAPSPTEAEAADGAMRASSAPLPSLIWCARAASILDRLGQQHN